MVTREDVESWLMRMGLEGEEVEEGMWIARTSDGGPGIVVHHTPPVMVFRLKVMEVPPELDTCGELFRRLLEKNATDVLHAAYAVDGQDVILTATLELENLDFNEFQATVDTIHMAVAAHAEELAPFRTC